MKNSGVVVPAQAGFTLLELLTVVTIIGVLAAIAYPSYLGYTRRANRSDATTSMTFMAQQLERCYSQNFSYQGCAQVPVGNSNSRNNHYTITLTVPAASSFTLVATPTGAANNPQNADTDCASFTMTSGGAQSALNGGGADSTAICWGTK